MREALYPMVLSIQHNNYENINTEFPILSGSVTEKVSLSKTTFGVRGDECVCWASAIARNSVRPERSPGFYTAREEDASSGEEKQRWVPSHKCSHNTL